MRAMEVHANRESESKRGLSYSELSCVTFIKKGWTCDSFDRFKQGSRYEMATLPQNNTPSNSTPVLIYSRFPGVLLTLPNFYAGADLFNCLRTLHTVFHISRAFKR